MVAYEPAPANGFERAAGAISHGSLLLGLPVLVPLAIYLLYPVVLDRSEYVKQQALQSLVFHVIASAIAGALVVVAIMFGLFAIVGAALNEGPLPSTWIWAFVALLAAMLVILWASILELVATVQALRGRPYSLPIVGAWFR